MEPVSSDQLAARTAEARERWGVPGMAVGILRDGDVIAASDGVREVGRSEPIAPDDVFRIASITKPFVATLVMAFVQDGLLDLDAPPPGTGTDATVRQLLSHQGALMCESREQLPIGRGELFSYSNAAFWLIGEGIAAAGDATFEEAMRVRVLQPLGLEATDFEPADGVPGHHPVAPGAAGHRRAVDEYPRARRPSGGLWSCISDLMRFAAHHLGGAPGPLTPDSLAELQRPESSGPGFRHGLGWFLTERGGRPVVEHSGSVAGYESLLLFIPDERLAFAALTNSSRGRAAIRDVLERLGLAPQARSDVELTPDELEAFAGRYVAPGVRTAVAVDGAHLRLSSSQRNPLTREITEFPPVVARPVGPREFEIVDGEFRGEMFGFPREGFLSFGVLSQRAS